MISPIRRRTFWRLLAASGLLLVFLALGLWQTNFGKRVARRVRRLSLHWPPGNQVSCQPAAASPIPRFEAQNAVIGGKLYVFGGFYTGTLQVTARSDVYDPATDTWQRIADLPIAVTHAGLVADGETAWMGGGFVGDHPGRAVRDVWKYDAVLDKWTQGPDLPAERASGGLVLLGRNLHFIGGLEEDRQTDSADHWVLSLDGSPEWSAKAALPEPRNHLGLGACQGKIYALGGQHGHDRRWEDVAVAHAYDPLSDSWQSIAPLPQPRSHFEPGMFVAAGQIVIAGGRSNYLPVLYNITAYDPVRDSWQELAALPLPLRAPLAKAIGEEVIVGNGGGLPSGVAPNEKMFRFPREALGLERESVNSHEGP